MPLPAVPTKPPNGVWVLDNGFKYRYFVSTRNLATILLAGYAYTATPRANRPGSIQWFGADGYCDLTAHLMDQNWPNHEPRPDKDPVAKAAQQQAAAGDTSAWNKLVKEGKRLNAEFRKDLTIRIDNLRTQHLQTRKTA